MKMSVHDALEELDADNDAHWTADGDPKLEALSELTGRKITRKEVKEAAPHFTRDNPELASIIEGEPNAEDEGRKEEGRQEEVTAAGPEASGGHAGEPEGDPAPSDPLRANPAALEVDSRKPESQQLDEAAQRVQLEIDRLIKERNRLHALASQAHTRETKDRDRHQGTRDRMTYIKRQSELRAARVGDQQRMANLIGISGPLAHAPSVLDQALAQRKATRGQTRPDHTPQAQERVGSATPKPNPVLGRKPGANG